MSRGKVTPLRAYRMLGYESASASRRLAESSCSKLPP